MSTPASNQTAPSAANLVTARTICLVLRKGKFGNTKKASLAGVTVDADKSLLHLGKRLLDSPELKAISQLDGDVQSYLKGCAFTSMFKGGVHLVPIAMVEAIDAALKDFAARRTMLVDLAVAAYPMRMTETSARLGDVYDPADYPSVERFKQSFVFEHSFVTFDTPTRLKTISAAIFAAETEKAQKRLTAVADECRDAMRAALATMVNHLVDRLTPDADGKPKKFTKTAVSNIHEFLATFAMRDVTDDAALATLAAKAKDVISGIDSATLKSDALVRQTVLDQMTVLSAQLKPLVEEQGTRDISFDDE